MIVRGLMEWITVGVSAKRMSPSETRRNGLHPIYGKFSKPLEKSGSPLLPPAELPGVIFVPPAKVPDYSFLERLRSAHV
jgi:hypothetical protein